MHFAYKLLFVSACLANEVELATDHLPKAIFEPTETVGMPAIPSIVSGAPSKIEVPSVESEPIHLEQLIDYQQTSC